MQTSVEGQRVLITAAASGIGYAFAKAFVENGARIHICDIQKDLLADCKKTLPDIDAHLRQHRRRCQSGTFSLLRGGK